MKAQDFKLEVNSTKLTENFEKQFGSKINLKKYDREQLEDMRNKVRTRVFQQEHAAGFNDLLTNETYQKDQALLQILNTRIKEMLGEDMKRLKDKLDQLSEAKKAKPDFLDLDGDGNKTEPMKKAAKDKKASKVKEEDVEEAFGAGSTFSRSSSRLDRKKSLPAVSPDADNEPRGGEINVPQKDREEIARILGNKDVKESKPSAGLSKAKKSAVVKKAKKGGDIGKKGKGFKDVAAKAAKQYGSKEKGEKVAAAAMWKNIKREDIQFGKNLKTIKEGLERLLNENEEAKAQAITAASDMVKDFSGWVQRVGNFQTKAMIELHDTIKVNFGQSEADQFKSTVSSSLEKAMTTLTAVREELSQAVAVLSGEQAAATPMGSEEPLPPATPDDLNLPAEVPAGDETTAGDEFAASDAAAGAGSTGRELREGQFAKKLIESHNIMSILSK